jgi:hypothetical protein
LKFEAEGEGLRARLEALGFAWEAPPKADAATSDTARVLLDKAAPPVADDQPQVNGTIEDGQLAARLLLVEGDADPCRGPPAVPCPSLERLKQQEDRPAPLAAPPRAEAATAASPVVGSGKVKFTGLTQNSQVDPAF